MVPLQKIYITAEQEYSMPSLHRKDTVIVQLTDEAGNIQGQGINHYTYTAPVKATVHLHKGQNGQIRLTHIMRRTQLSGITDIGITLTHEDCGN
jgi:gliding motility-associated lipoprotein GldH